MPPAGDERDRFVLEILGTPDPMQIDGLGGTHSSTSKLVTVGPSTRSDADVDYLFVQGGIDKPTVDYRGNCGNLTSAVGAFAIDEGLVEASEPVTVVRMFNENTGKMILGHIPVDNATASTEGDCEIAGVPGTGARILNEYLDPAGAVHGALLPTGNARDVLEVPGLGDVEVSIVDATTPVVYARAAALGLTGLELPAQITQDPELVERFELVRGAALVKLGVVARIEDAATKSAATPTMAIVIPPCDAPLSTGGTLDPDSADLVARIASVGRIHHAFTMTGVMCTAAAAHIPGTIPFEVARRQASGWVRIGHPKGVASAQVKVDPQGPTVESITVERTARRLMAGDLYLRGEYSTLGAG